MNRKAGVASAKPRAPLLLVAVLAMLATGAASNATAWGVSGGVSPDGGTQSREPVTKGKAKHKRQLRAKYRRQWRKLSRRDRRWARRTAKCESGRDPKAIGGGGKYRGAFQFLRSTWRRAPKSPGGDPINYPYRVQAVVAVALKRREGAGHWPTCG